MICWFNLLSLRLWGINWVIILCMLLILYVLYYLVVICCSRVNHNIFTLVICFVICTITAIFYCLICITVIIFIDNLNHTMILNQIFNPRTAFHNICSYIIIEIRYPFIYTCFTIVSLMYTEKMSLVICCWVVFVAHVAKVFSISSVE